MFKRRNKFMLGLLAVLSSCIGFQTAASAGTTPAAGAVKWAEAQLGHASYYGQCLQFVHDAYVNGGGFDIGSVGSANGALTYWQNHTNAQQSGTNPPVGALVFWGATTAGNGKIDNPDGHVALSIGNGMVVSSYEESTTTIHNFAISSRNAAGYPYLGWLIPSPSYADGTYLRASDTGGIYVMAGGSPMWVSSLSHVPPIPTWVTTTQAIVNSMPKYPTNNTWIRDYTTGGIYIVAGGAPMWVSSFTQVPSPPAHITNVDDWAIHNQLKKYPVDSTFVRDYKTGGIFEIQNQAPMYISSMSQVSAPPVNIDDWAIRNQLGCYINIFLA